MDLSLDEILGVIAPEATYQTVASKTPNQSWQGFWYKDWVSGPNKVEAPSYAQVVAAAQLMVAAGQNQTIESGMAGVMRLVDTVALQKVVAATPKDPAITVMGILALGAIFLYLHEPSDAAGLRARTVWGNFIQYTLFQREITGIVGGDVVAFNAEIDALGFPMWLKIGG